MSSFAEAAAEIPVIGWIFKVWLKLPEPGRQLIFYLLYPLVAFVWLVALLQILSSLFNIEPFQRWALRGLGIDTDNLASTSSVIDTVSVVSFDSDLPKDLDPVFIRRGQGIALLALLQDQGLRPKLTACAASANVGGPEEHTELGTFEVHAAGFVKKIPLVYLSERQPTEVISAKDWREIPALKEIDERDVKVSIRYKAGKIYHIPDDAKSPQDFPAGSPAADNPFLACQKYKVVLNVRIAKPELSMGHFGG